MPLKRSAFNLRHQQMAERVQPLSGALHFAKICTSGFCETLQALQFGCVLKALRSVRCRASAASFSFSVRAFEICWLQ